MKIHELKYSNTNTFLIEGDSGKILFDTGWAGTFPAFCKSIGELHVSAQEIDYILISHFHPDHMGIAQEIADLGPVVVVMDLQRDHMHDSDVIFAKEKDTAFVPIADERVRILQISESREFLKAVGIDGEILSTPGHSDDSISLCLDSGEVFVGDLNPLYELELHRETQIEDSWNKILKANPKVVYYGHAKATEIAAAGVSASGHDDVYKQVSKIMKLIDKGVSLDRIQKKTGADTSFVEDVARMYLTHQNVGVQGIFDRIEIKGK